MRWVRLGLLLAIVSLAGLALTQATAGPSAVPVVAEVQPTPAPSATRVPLPTAPPRMIISRVVRETPTPRATSTPSTQPRVTLVDNGYLPAQLTVHAGQTVEWTNSGSDGHDVIGNGPGGVWRSGPLAPAERYQRQFALVGMYDYQCSIHPEMRGQLVVQP